MRSSDNHYSSFSNKMTNGSSYSNSMNRASASSYTDPYNPSLSKTYNQGRSSSYNKYGRGSYSIADREYRTKPFVKIDERTMVGKEFCLRNEYNQFNCFLNVVM